MTNNQHPEQVQTLIVGAGQAGLSVGYFLAQRKRSFLIIDGSEKIGDAWRSRWDSLRLFTPARFDALAGMPFPAAGQTFPTKDQMADYLQAYADRFKLPVRNGIRVDGLTRTDNGYRVTAGERVFEAENVVVAMSGYQQPRLPAFSAELAPGIVQMHSREYRNPKQLQPGGVLLVGAGNSGSEIAVELGHLHQTWMSGRDTGYIPFRINGLAARLFLQRLIFRVVFHRLLTVNTPMGRKARTKALSQGTPLIRVRPSDLVAAGVERVPRVAGVSDGLPRLADGRILQAANVIWCTGFHPGFSWIHLPVFDKDGTVRHQSGVVTTQPGLYFVGLPFLHALSSTMIHGVARDAERIAQIIATRTHGSVIAAKAHRPIYTSKQPSGTF